MIIYKITNLKNGKSYIGQTLRPMKTRRAEHLRAASNVADVKHPTPLHVAINEHGSAQFEWETLEECNSVTHMNEREKFYIKLLNTQTPNGYNQTTGGAIDETMSEETRRKISDSMVKLHDDPEYTSNLYPQLKGLIPPNKGTVMSEEQRAKVGAARKAVHNDPTYVNPNVGQKRTGQALDNLHKAFETRELPTGDAWKAAHGDQYTAEVRAKMRAAKVGKKPANTKKIMCVETGTVYSGLTEAASATGANRQSIWLQIKGKLKSAGGLTFKYV